MRNKRSRERVCVCAGKKESSENKGGIGRLSDRQRESNSQRDKTVRQKEKKPEDKEKEAV